MWIKRILRAVAVLASAFVLTSAVMFWLPFFERVAGYDVYDYMFTPRVGGYSFDYSYDMSIEDLKKLSPIVERELLNEISTEPKKKANPELYQMKAFEDVCANDVVDCQGLASSKIKPFIDAILSDRQSAETAFYYRTANITSGGSLFISFVALIFAGLTYLRRGSARTVKD